MATIKFTDYTYDRLLILELQKPQAGENEAINVTMCLLDKNKNILHETSGTVSKKLMLDLANWHETLYKDSPDFHIPELDLKFEWGWFEKGELYYRTYIYTESSPTGSYVLHEYHQGDHQAKFVADKMRKELASLKYSCL